MIAFTPSLTFRLILNPLSVRRVTPTALISLFMDFASVGTRDSFTLYFRSDTACSHLPSSHIAAPGVSPSQGACRAAAPSLSATDAICLSRRARGSGLRKIIRHTDPYILISSAGLIQRASSPTFFISPARAIHQSSCAFAACIALAPGVTAQWLPNGCAKRQALELES